jgi:hypothetical protein
MSDSQRQSPSASHPQGPASAGQHKEEGFGTYASPASRPQPGPDRTRTAWTGWVSFAGILMILIGVFQAIEGLVAIFRDVYFLVTSSGLLLTIDYTAWGWMHLIIGLLIAASGFAVMRGLVWGRVVGVILASLSALANLAFLSAYPLWSALMIALNVAVIFALTVHGSEVGES